MRVANTRADKLVSAMNDDKPDEPSLVGRIKDKLIHSKEEWAKEGRLLTGRPDAGHVNRLPPGQKEVKNWPVLDLGVQPDLWPDKWRLQVMGLVDNPVAPTLQQFKALPQQDFVSPTPPAPPCTPHPNPCRTPPP